MSGTALAGEATRRRVTVAERDKERLRRLAVVAIAVGVGLRLLAPFVMDLWEDGTEYVAMGHAWSLHHEFYLPFGEARGVEAPQGPGHSHHYPPAYPFYLGLVFSVFGFGLVQAKAAMVVLSLAAVAVVFLATRDIYGRDVALLTTGLVALEPHLLWVTGTGYSENMVLLFFALTMWAIVKSLTDERFIVLAGLFAGLSYLSRASVGYFFLVAGVGGFLWRFHYHRWKLFRNAWYMLAIALFGAIVLSWAGRNVMLFGWPHWQTSAYLAYANGYALENPGLWVKAIFGKLPFFVLTFAFYAAPFLPQLRKAVKDVRRESTSVLFLSIVLVWVLAWLVTATFWPYEGRSFFFLEHHRYVLLGLVPLAWLVFRDTPPERLRLPWTTLATALLVISLLVVASPVRQEDKRAYEDLARLVRPGDEVLLVKHFVYEAYPYLDDPTSVNMLPRDLPHFFVAPDVRPPSEEALREYRIIGTYVQHHLFSRDTTTYLLARNDVAQERGIPDLGTRSGWLW